jgi:hypothetical protein
MPVQKLDRISLYLPPATGIWLLEEIAVKGCDQLWLNPGSDAPEMVARACELELDPIVACSIVDAGVTPHELPD